MRFLADESCDFAVVRALRSGGHDVRSVAEISPRAEDGEVMALARREERVLLTEDKDFGQLAYAFGAPTAGVILIRYPTNKRSELGQTILSLIRERGSSLEGRFVVVRPGRIRFGPALESQ